jgi:hypothetical protein
LTKGNDPMPSVTNSSAPFLGLSFDAIRTSLNDLKDSTDVFPPLKSAVGAVLAVWDLADVQFALSFPYTSS